MRGVEWDGGRGGRGRKGGEERREGGKEGEKEGRKEVAEGRELFIFPFLVLPHQD